MTIKSFLKTIVPVGVMTGSVFLSGCHRENKSCSDVVKPSQKAPSTLLAVNTLAEIEVARTEAIYKAIQKIEGAFISYLPFPSADGKIRVGFGVPISEEAFLKTQFYQQTKKGALPYPLTDNPILLNQLKTKGQTEKIRLRDKEIRQLTKAWISETYPQIKQTLPCLDQLPISTLAAIMLLEMNSDSIHIPASPLRDLAQGGVDLEKQLEVFLPAQLSPNDDVIPLPSSSRSPKVFEKALVTILRHNKIPHVPPQYIPRQVPDNQR